MKIGYDIIKQNIATYEEAKSILPVISQYEKGEVSASALVSLGLRDFLDFHNFKKSVEDKGYSLVMDINWRKLKPILVDKTDTPRLKKYIFNRSKPSFDGILNDKEVFDRLVNGRWISKPKQRSNRSRRGGYTSGRRSDEKVEALTYAIAPLINYIIINDLEVVDGVRYENNASVYVKWYTERKLSLDAVPKREIDITNKLLSSLDNIIEESKIDFRKLNLDYITNAINTKISKLMTIPDGTPVKCLRDVINDFGSKILSKDVYYETKGTNISGGKLRVYIADNFNRNNWFDYSYFEDMAMHRDDLLNSLFGE